MGVPKDKEGFRCSRGETVRIDARDDALVFEKAAGALAKPVAQCESPEVAHLVNTRTTP